MWNVVGCGTSSRDVDWCDDSGEPGGLNNSSSGNGSSPGVFSILNFVCLHY